MLDEAGTLPSRVLVLDDIDGALTGAVAAAGVDVRCWCDDVRDEALVPPPRRVALGAGAFGGVELVLWRLPTALTEVAEVAEAVSRCAPDGVRLVAGGRVKHMTPRQNDVLARSFADVRASLGRDKSRVLHASGPLRPAPTWPRTRRLPSMDMVVVAHGGTFATNTLDAGTRMLLGALADAGMGGDRRADGGWRGRAVDLGCGSGILASWLGRAGWTVSASDVSWWACESTRATAAANGLADRVAVARRDGLAGAAAGSADLIVSNPPFHRGAAKESGDTLAMIADAARVLDKGGELWLVFNSHLPYLATARRTVGPTEIAARDPRYTVIRSVRR